MEVMTQTYYWVPWGQTWPWWGLGALGEEGDILKQKFFLYMDPPKVPRSGAEGFLVVKRPHRVQLEGIV